MNLYALLIGVTDYPVKPLGGCIEDTEKIEKYLEGLSDQFETSTIKRIANEDATKDKIIEQINTILGQAKDDDVALLYYSGHGAQEKTDGRFPTEQDGALECIVAYYEEGQTSGFLLADKELRYLFTQFEHEPHFVTLFDCCHSGSMVRAAKAPDTTRQVKRLSGFFPARDYSEFIFESSVSMQQLKDQGLPASIGFKNHIHVAACGPSQSSWEDLEGGVFTNYLLDLLKVRNNQINYQDLTRWAKLSIRGNTRKQQTPTVSIQGEGKLNAKSNWLNLPMGDTIESGALSFDEDKGWVYNRGALMGIQKGASLNIIKPNGDTFKAEVEKVDPEFSFVGDLFGKGVKDDDLLEVVPDTIYGPINVYLNNLDQDTATEQEVKDLLKNIEHIQWVKTADLADYYLNIFNQQLYISLADWEFRPIAQQIDLLDLPTERIDKDLKEQLSYLIKWHHFLTLDNPGQGFRKHPIKIEANIIGTTKWVDITGIDFNVKGIQEGDQFLQYLDIRVTNITKETLFVAPINLWSNLGIDTDGFDDQAIELPPGKSKKLYDFTEDDTSIIYFENYQSIYNWPFEYWNINFVVSNFEDFSTSLPDFFQPALPNPFTIDLRSERGEQDAKGGGSSRKVKVVKRWGTVKTCIKISNPEYNIISGDLATGALTYQADERIAPFIAQLYLDFESQGWNLEPVSKPNLTGDDVNAKGLPEIKLFIGNFWDDGRRRRIFKKAKKRFPEKPTIVAEGDSWFLYPILIKDTIDYVMEHLPVRSIAAAGDELENYKLHGQLLKVIGLEKPEFVMISGGGNDIIGEEIQHLLIEGIATGSPAKDFLNEKFQENMDKLEELYTFFFEEIAKDHSFVKQVFVHGYDYVLPSDNPDFLANGWVNRYFKEKGINEFKDRGNIIHLLVDTFNDMLEKLCSNNDLITYVNNRGIVNEDEWYDEIHPTDAGFKKVGDNFLTEIKKFQTN